MMNDLSLGDLLAVLPAERRPDDFPQAISAPAPVTPFSPEVERHILIIDWEEKKKGSLARLLQLNSLMVTLADRPNDVIRQIRLLMPSLILVSASLLQEKAAAVFSQIRSVSPAPIVVWSDSINEWECVMMLGMGADDYIEKSANPHVLVARIRAALRRVDETASRIQRSTPTPVGKFIIRPGSNDVIYSGTLIRMSSIDFVVFQRLFESMGQIVTRAQLLEAIRQPMTEAAIHALGMRIYRLRRQCERAGAPATSIRCVRNVGYALTGS